MKESQKPLLNVVPPKKLRSNLLGRRVLLIDSGLGLLSIAGAIHAEYPMLKLLAISDSAGFPWGDKSQKDLTARVALLAQYGIEHWDVEAIVVACNTASVIVLEHLRQIFSIPIIGVVPAIKPAAHYSKKGIIGVLATNGTIQRDYVRKLIDDFADDCKVIMVGSKNLATIAENKLQGKGVDKQLIAEEMAPFMKHQVDAIALACTHYPLLQEELEGITGTAVRFFEPSTAVAHQLARKLYAAAAKSVSSLDKNIVFATGDAYQLDENFLQQYGFDALEKLAINDV